MPKATVNPADTERKDLKSLPEGFVVLRRLTFGQKLERNALAMDMEVEEGDRKNESKASMRTNLRAVAEFEFKHCIVEHNLTDENDQLLNFQSVKVLDQLHPVIGDEIDQLISGMNNFEEDELGN